MLLLLLLVVLSTQDSRKSLRGKQQQVADSYEDAVEFYEEHIRDPEAGWIWDYLLKSNTVISSNVSFSQKQ